MELTGTYDRRARDEVAIPTLQFDQAPKYFVVGGLVFQELTGAYLQEWGDKWSERAPQRLVEYFTFQQDKRPDPEKKVIFLSQVLPSPITLGYQQLSGLVLVKLNGKEIHDLAELAKCIDETKTGDLVFEFRDEPGKLILRAEDLPAVSEKIGQAYGLPALRRL